MSALAERIAGARAEGRAALIAYLPVGYPDVPGSIEAMTAAVEGGADIVEIGVPYSDPGMDGPTIQEVVEVAVRAGVGMRDVLAAVSAVAAAGAVPVVMSYWNPIERYGVDRFATDLAAAGGAGAITPDLVPDEAAAWLDASDRVGLDRVFLVAPSSTEARLLSTTAACRGFVYAASTMGVTGTRSTVSGTAEQLVTRTRAAAADLAVCVGLGVSDGDQAAEVAAFADGVIVGSAYVRALVDGGPEAVRALSVDLAAGVRRGQRVPA
ncbi:tryptophan synthase subunit alpha [Modestobacter sp. I12A-02628]|uniref:Tryptophan synthase alpha chain n=1 Tax=Goekera deserti TaxID=2497753 RepID=A0A7K3WA86_9ACTN|nr:tryptophan synthase subunit alpha [Goekera deserti]MPQ99229.1 tryptophan synthase subunit alpha [Goekera deserti]NDI47564.1 tryptophan synthase subunit alpha [Goekera deserti]NEL53375.1 tryptophan synthase subunit alpha [Goekera deserti]